MNVDGVILLWHVRPVLLGSTPAIRRPHVSCLDPVPVGLYGFRPGVRGGPGCVALPARARVGGKTRNPPGAQGARPGGTVSCESGGALLSHTLSGAVPSPCRALASGFGMGPGVSPWPWPPQILSTFPGTSRGDRTVTVREPDNGREKSLVTHSGRSLPWGIIRRTQYGPPPGNPDDGV